MRTRRPFVICVLAALTAGAAPAAAAEDGPLDRYLKKPDATYAWKVVKTAEADGVKTFVVHLKSQTWRTKEDVDRPVWEHWVTVVRPAKPVGTTAFLNIGGGANDGKMPEGPSAAALIAAATNAVAVELRMVPNQPLTFHNDGKPRKEDDLLGYAWDQYLKTGDATWLPRLPMVKSVVRAMDCVQELLKSEEGGGVKVDKFVVAGGSKRGWTAWLTAAGDPRVAAVVPIVIDVVNVKPSMQHHAEAYGFWARAVGDYVHHGLMARRDHPRMDDLYAVEDPYAYRDRLTMPKYIVNASGDQFFLPDSSQFYYDGLKGEKLLRYVPNADHSLRGSDAVESILAYYGMLLADKPRPQYSWVFEKDGGIRVTAKGGPKEVLLWQAVNPKARDFRVDTIGKAYKSVALKPEADGTYVGKVEVPKEGWTAFFVELAYDSGGKSPLKVTTAVRVLPDKLPHAGVDLKKVPYELTPKPEGR